MTISSLVLGAKRVIDAAWQNGTAYDLSSQAAFALESAQLLQSPEMAAELVQLRNDVTGACLARWEEEQENARLRLALESAKRGRREARGLLEITEDSRKRWRDAEIESTRELKALRARVAELEAERHVTNEALSDAAEQLRADRDRIAEADARREALAERLRAGQHWQRGRTPELVSENYVSQSELREIFGIPLAAPWADGITQRIAPTQALREAAAAEAGA